MNRWPPWLGALIWTVATVAGSYLVGYLLRAIVGYSELGGLNKWLHIWPYASIDQRNATRDKARDAGIWPPAAVAAKAGAKSIPYIAQENKIVMPASFSPLQ